MQRQGTTAARPADVITVDGPASTERSVFFVGTATTIVRYAGFTILTDPNFLHRGQLAYLGHGLWSKRRTEPVFPSSGLPPLDVVILSHLHGDHFDRVARRTLAGNIPLLTTRQAAAKLRDRGFPAALGLHIWQTQEIRRGEARLRVTAVPGQHALGRARHLGLPPVIGTVLEFLPGPGTAPLTIYITGDTLLYDGLRAIRERFPAPDLMLLHLGGTRILGMLVTMDGRQGAAALDLIRPHSAIPIHYDDYGVFRSPLSDFRREMERRDGTVMVSYLDRGESTPIDGAYAKPPGSSLINPS
jgi:L-ascorbate metabolism protein UlaG (beta-lactamase superfamily)